MGGQGRVIERTLYTDIVNGLKKLGFDAYSESKAGTGRDFPDVICIYNEKKIVIEVKFGNIEQNNPNIEELGQGKRYAEKLGIDKSIERYPSLFIGSFELSPFDAIQSYQTIAADGIFY